MNTEINFLRKIELFKGLTEEEYSIISDGIIRKNYKSGDLLFSQNSPRRYIYLIVSGDVGLYKVTPYGKEEQIALFSKYDFLGEGSLTDDSPHSTTAKALDECEVLQIPGVTFEKNGSIALKTFSNIAKVISRRMRHANNRLIRSASQYESGRTRTEHDLLGYREVPYESYYGVQTLRGMENFNITGVTLNFYPDLVEALAIVKMGAAKANFDLGLLDKNVCDAIVKACDEIIHGKFQFYFVVDMIQGGAGTSTNMNANEVIANRALEILGYEKGDYVHCHPNNHVNLSQSTNDAYPTAVHIALYNNNIKLLNFLSDLISAFDIKAAEFANIIKMGRTQLQDAVPMTLGQTFMAFANTLREEINILQNNANLFLEINMGATAIGTGICSEAGYANRVVEHLRKISGLDLALAPDLVEATSDTGSFVMYSAAVKRLAVKLSKICNDLRLLSSGPRCGFGEINLPPMQPGSSIMPGKVNPVIPEVVNQIAFKVIGNDLTVNMASEAGQLELNVMEPVMVQCLFESVEMLKNGMDTLNNRCIIGITANEKVCRDYVENSIGLVTALNPYIGYEASTEIAAEALETGKRVYDLVLEKNLLSKKQIDEILKPENMIKPGKIKVF